MEETQTKDAITIGFTQNQAILLSPLLRKLFPLRNISACTDMLSLKAALTPRHIIICNGSADFFEIDAVCLLAEKRKAAVEACNFAGVIKDSSLLIAQGYDIRIILGELMAEEELTECAAAARSGRHYMSKSLCSYKARQYTSFVEYFNLLTIRERVACMGMLQGYKHDIIAQLLGVTKSTADTYCSKVLAKFGAESIMELFQFFAFKNL